MTVPQPWLSSEQLAKVLGVHVRWVQEQVSARALPHHRVGRLVRFTPDDFRAIEKSHGRQADRPPAASESAMSEPTADDRAERSAIISAAVIARLRREGRPVPGIDDEARQRTVVAEGTAEA